MSKGLTENAVYAIIVVLMIGVLSTVTIDQIIGVGELIRRETVQMTGDRIEAAVTSADSVDEAKIQLELGGKNGYKIYSEGGEKYLNYEYLESSKETALEDPQGVDFSIPRDKDDGRINYICIQKSSGIRITGGEC